MDKMKSVTTVKKWQASHFLLNLAYLDLIFVVDLGLPKEYTSSLHCQHN